MKTSKKSVAGTAFNFFFVFGMLTSLNGGNGVPPVGSFWEIALGYLIRVGMPVLFGIIGAMFTYSLLNWYEQTRTDGTGKAGDDN